MVLPELGGELQLFLWAIPFFSVLLGWCGDEIKCFALIRPHQRKNVVNGGRQTQKQLKVDSGSSF